MTRAYSVALKQQLVARLTGVNALSAAQLARETGIKQQNLSRWLSEARSSPFGAPRDEIVASWTVEQKARIIAQSLGLAGDRLTTYLRGEGVKLGYFRRWRVALEEAGEESVGMAKRIRKLERELARKERALAEAAALLLLRETIKSQNQKEDDGFDEQVEGEDESNPSMPAGAALADNPTPSPSIADYMRRNHSPLPEFYDRREFPWVKGLEMQTARIRSEAQAILGSDGWAPYIESESRRPNANANPLLQDPNWSAFYLIKDGSEVALNAQPCPAAMAALRELPLCKTGRTPSVLFSLLRPGTRIKPHHGFMNARLICHLPLIIPEDCALRVGNETRAWREGEVVLFDDSVEHEAWNLSKELRVVMIFDVWRSELSAKECTLVGAMLDAVDQFDRLPQRV